MPCGKCSPLPARMERVHERRREGSHPIPPEMFTFVSCMMDVLLGVFYTIWQRDKTVVDEGRR